jgi:DNA replication protein DnaC
MDDLGAELTNQFTVSSLYNIINTRINSGKSMIISTNLGQNALLERYDERITSRLFGKFYSYMFKGTDIRRQK